MRVIPPIQNLNNRQNVKSNQTTNFRGIFVNKSPQELISIFGKDSAASRTIDILGQLIEKVTKPSVKVEVSNIPENEVRSMFMNNPKIKEARIVAQNLKMDIFVNEAKQSSITTYLDPQSRDINSNINTLLLELIEKAPENMNWVEFVSAFKKN